MGTQVFRKIFFFSVFIGSLAFYQIDIYSSNILRRTKSDSNIVIKNSKTITISTSLQESIDNNNGKVLNHGVTDLDLILEETTAMELKNQSKILKEEYEKGVTAIKENLKIEKKIAKSREQDLKEQALNEQQKEFDRLLNKERANFKQKLEKNIENYEKKINKNNELLSALRDDNEILRKNYQSIQTQYKMLEKEAKKEAETTFNLTEKTKFLEQENLNLENEKKVLKKLLYVQKTENTLFQVNLQTEKNERLKEKKILQSKCEILQQQLVEVQNKLNILIDYKVEEFQDDENQIEKEGFTPLFSSVDLEEKELNTKIEQLENEKKGFEERILQLQKKANFAELMLQLQTRAYEESKKYHTKSKNLLRNNENLADQNYTLADQNYTLGNELELNKVLYETKLKNLLRDNENLVNQNDTLIKDVDVLNSLIRSLDPNQFCEQDKRIIVRYKLGITFFFLTTILALYATYHFYLLSKVMNNARPSTI